MNDRVLIRTGAAGAILAAICCATPILAVLLPLVGLGAWLARADLMLFPLLATSLGLIAWGFIGATPTPPVARRRLTKKA